MTINHLDLNNSIPEEKALRTFICRDYNPIKKELGHFKAVRQGRLVEVQTIGKIFDVEYIINDIEKRLEVIGSKYKNKFKMYRDMLRERVNA